MSDLYERDDAGVLHPYIEEPPIHPWRWRALSVWIVVFSIFVAWAVNTALDASHKNNQAIHELRQTQSDLKQAQSDLKQAQQDIQTSRLASCKRTYNSFQQVFNPFFTKQQRQQPNFKKFQRVLIHLKAGCKKVITPPPVPNKSSGG